MAERESSEPIKLYLDDATEPFKVATPPLTFQFDTIVLPDGPHRLRIEASNGLAPPTVKTIPFVVRNGVAITSSGLDPGQTIAGQVQMVVNAYAGSTEVDFEPRRAETPQPIPTWAWVVLLAVAAWTMYYLITPQVHSSAATPVQHRPSDGMGARVFADACARCHGEDGRGQAPKVPALRDAEYAVTDSAGPLLIKVTAPAPGTMMPDWGTRLTNEELVSVVNHIRRSWDHDSSRIELSHRRPPDGIVRLHEDLQSALRQKDLVGLLRCCGENTTIQPQIFRTDGVDQRGLAGVGMAWVNYLQALDDAGARVTELSLPDARYDYDPATVDQQGAVVIATGRIFLGTENDRGEKRTAKGRFIRVYENTPLGWSMVFDFADIPMAIGCVPGTVICKPGEEPPPLPDASRAGAPAVPSPTGAAIGYAEVQALLRGLKKKATTAPHETFWDFSHREFVAWTFPPDWGEAGVIRMLVPGDAAASNLMRALRDGKGIVVDLPGGTQKTIDVGPMPKGGPKLSAADLAKIEAWIDAGCPEFGAAPGDPAPAWPPPARQVPDDVPPGVPADPFPPPTATPPPPPTPAPGGFPPPSPAPAPLPGGFPPPSETPPVPPPAEERVLTYAEVQALLKRVGEQPGAVPHGAFWTLPYGAFVRLSFALEEGEPGRVRLLVPGNAKASNLVRALRDGKGIVVNLPNGERKTVDVPHMPRGGTALSEAEVAKIEAWIDAGCPEHGAVK